MTAIILYTVFWICASGACSITPLDNKIANFWYRNANGLIILFFGWLMIAVLNLSVFAAEHYETNKSTIVDAKTEELKTMHYFTCDEITTCDKLQGHGH